jgi:hypothetical protein
VTMKLNFKYPVYPDLKILPKDNRAYALWYYYTLAQKLAEKLGDGSAEAQFGILEGEQWLNPQYEQIARSVAMIYGFSDPGVFMEPRFWEVVERQAFEIDLPAPAQCIKAPRKLIGFS